MLGTGGGGLPFVEAHYAYFYEGTHQHKASIYIIPAATHGTLSSELSMAFGLRGLSHVISTGCTSSTDAIAYAAQHIAVGRQEVMLAGGVDAPLAPGILAGFNLLTVLTTAWNDEPHRASCPGKKAARGASAGRQRRGRFGSGLVRDGNRHYPSNNQPRRTGPRLRSGLCSEHGAQS